MDLFVAGIIIFIMSVTVIELSFYAFRHMRAPARAKIRKRLRKYSYVQSGDGSADILKKRVLSDVPTLNRLLLRTPGIRALDRLILQANAAYPLGFYLLLTVLLATLAFTGTRFLTRTYSLPILVAIIAGSLPCLKLRWMKHKRIEKFKRQLPEGLDLIARAMKAGHALTTGMRLAADEFEDPFGPEMDETLDEINFGVSVAEALKNFAGRIDCQEIKYFVVAVILQRETGGNLAELMESLAALIRDKFKFQGKVRTLSAEGKLSAIILSVLPFMVLIAIRFTSPEYIMSLFTEPVGRLLLLGSAIMMVTGIMIMKSMVNIKV
jgi:tight adherence protein B